MKKDKDIFGYIKFVNVPTFISNKNKFLIEVRSYNPITKLEYNNFEMYCHTIDILRKRKLKRSRGRIGKIIELMDKEEGNTFYHYLFYISCNEKYDPDDVAQHMKEHLEREEKCEIQSAYGEQVKLWPWEKPKVTKRIPMTQEMVDGLVKSFEVVAKKAKEKS